MLDKAEADALVLKIRGRVYNRHLRKACGHIVIDEIAVERGKSWDKIVRMVLQESGIIEMPSLPAPLGVMDRDGLKTFEAERARLAKIKADDQKQADLRRRQESQQRPAPPPPPPAPPPDDDPFASMLLPEAADAP